MSKKNLSPVEALDEARKTFEKALVSLYKKNWATAQRDFEKVGESQVGTPLAERSRRYLAVCKARRAEDSEHPDAYLQAVVAKNDGDFAAALELCNRGGLKGRDERFAYLAAALENLQENREESALQLARAIELNPANRVHAYHDPDFVSLREDPEHAAIFAVD